MIGDVAGPAASVPAGAVEPRAELPPYSTVTVVAAPRGLTEPAMVAVCVPIDPAAPVLAVGASWTSARAIAFGVPLSTNHSCRRARR